MKEQGAFTRREALKGMVGSALATASGSALIGQAAPAAAEDSIKRWDFIELRFPGPSSGNPFLEVHLSATLRYNNRSLTVEGFYDGAGEYKVRFMPDEPGRWTWTPAASIWRG